MALQATTYVTALANDGEVEYGYSFHHNGSEDSIFDLVVGVRSNYDSSMDAGIEAELEEQRWAADAIVAASPYP